MSTATLRHNQELEINRQIQASNFGNTPVEIPQNDNDAALAGHIQEIREQSEEYAKLQTEESRQQWEAIATANFQRNKAQKDGITAQMGAAKMNQAMQDRTEAERLFSERDAIAQNLLSKDGKPLAIVSEWTVSQDDLRDAAINAQKIYNLTGVDITSPQPQAKQPPQNRPDTFPDGEPVHVTRNQDGTMTVEYVTGERFTGDPMAVTQQIGKSHVETKRWAQQQRGQQPTAQPTNQPTAQPTEQTASGSLADDLAARQADALAKQFGFSDRTEMMQWGEGVNQMQAKIQQFEREKAATEFCTRVPEFPATPQAIEAVAQIMDNMQLPETAESMQMAHAFAVSKGIYQPLSAEAVQASYGTGPAVPTRQAAPPMLRGNNPEMIHGQNNDPYNMNLAELRKAAIAQELNGGGSR